MGYAPSLFWECTILEIYDLMESYTRRQNIRTKEYEARLKAQASLNSVLARQIREYVGALFSKDARITPLNEIFPTLFEDEVQKNNDMALYKARMKDFVYRHNQKMKRKEE